MRPIHELRQSSFELAKWIAIAAMAVDHYGKIVASDIGYSTHLIGRVAFPLFAWIIACRLALRPELTARYARWLLPWAVISQPVFWYSGREWYEPNILFELLAGVLVVYAIDAWGMTRRALAIVAMLACLGWFFDYGPVGVLSIGMMLLAARRGMATSLLALAVVGVLVNLPASSRAEIIAAAVSLLSPLIAWLSLRVTSEFLPRLPKWIFYAFYPSHLLALAYYGRMISGIG